MDSKIVIHLMPNEIDWFEWQCKQIKIGSNFIEDKHELIFDITLNLNQTDWNLSKIPKKYFIDKFKNICNNYLDSFKVLQDINEDNSILGVCDKRRKSIRETINIKNIIYLDSDIIFKPETLGLLLNSSKLIQDKYYIISPQISKIWDESWDVLVNNQHINDSWDNINFIDPFSHLSKDYGDFILTKSPYFKLGGGWFNLISLELLKLVDLPDSFGCYGPDDTYLMGSCHILKNHKEVNQYILNNLVVYENHKYRINNYENFLISKNKREEDRKQSEVYLQKELENFYNKVNTKIWNHQ